MAFVTVTSDDGTCIFDGSTGTEGPCFYDFDESGYVGATDLLSCSWKPAESVVRNIRRVGLFSEQKVVPLNFHLLVFLLVKGEKL